MKACVVNIIGVVAMAALVFSAPASANTGFCNRFLAFAAKVAGNPTEEFKRRIAYLLETGKIGEEHLTRMQASEAPASPFESGQHLSSDIVPHVSAISRLVMDKALDWNEVRGFVEKLRKRVVDSDSEGKAREKETRVVIYPTVVATIKVEDAVGSYFRIFRNGDVPYVVFGLEERKVFKVYVASALTGKIVQIIGPDEYVKKVSGPIVFESGGKTYLAVELCRAEKGRIVTSVLVYDPLTGKRVRETKTGDGGRLRPVTFKHNGRTYLITSAPDVIEPLTGKRIKRVELDEDAGGVPSAFEVDGEPWVAVSTYSGGIYTFKALSKGSGKERVAAGEEHVSSSAIFRKGGNTYLVVGLRSGDLEVYDVRTGDKVREVRLGGWISSAPVSFEKEGIPYVVAESNDGVFVVRIDTGEVIRKFRAASGDSSPVVFEKEKEHYLLLGFSNKSLCLFEPLTGRLLKTVKLPDEIIATPQVFERDGWVHVAVATKDGKVRVIRLVGIPDGQK